MLSRVHPGRASVYIPQPPSHGRELPDATDHDVSKQIWYRARFVDTATHADDRAGLSFEAANTVLYLR
jgi:hypothetical protein